MTQDSTHNWLNFGEQVTTTMLDPPQRVASPMAPALMGPGPRCCAQNAHGRAANLSPSSRFTIQRIHLTDILELLKVFRMMLGKVAHHFGVAYKITDIALGNG